MNNLDHLLSTIDFNAIPEFDDKLKECEFFFNALSKEKNRNNFRWLVSAFLNSSYSYFESSALTAHVRFTDAESGHNFPDHETLDILNKYVEVKVNPRNPKRVDTNGLTPLTRMLYDFRKKSTHHFPLSIMEVGELPEGFQFGSTIGEGVPVMQLCREALDLIRSINVEINK